MQWLCKCYLTEVMLLLHQCRFHKAYARSISQCTTAFDSIKVGTRERDHMGHCKLGELQLCHCFTSKFGLWHYFGLNCQKATNSNDFVALRALDGAVDAGYW
jgi:hypothetical protein